MTSALVRTAPVVALLGCLLATSACTSSGSTTDKTSSPAPSSTAPSAPTSTAASTPPTQYPLPAHTPPNVILKRKSVTQTSCQAIPGGWSAGGTARNATAKPVSYEITVFFTTTQATYIDYAQTEVSVPAHGSANWSASKRFAAPKAMLCVLRGVG